MENLNSAFSLLVVGMLTVFGILFLVVTSTSILIRIVNRFYPIGKPTSIESDSIIKTSQNKGEVVSAIIATVDIITRGKGKIKGIKRI